MASGRRRFAKRRFPVALPQASIFIARTSKERTQGAVEERPDLQERIAYKCPPGMACRYTRTAGETPAVRVPWNQVSLTVLAVTVCQAW